jgi:DNA-binding NtrC family response regulator
MDTDSAIRLLYSDDLSEEGYDVNVITCGDAAELMELIRYKNPDLVVMEVLLDNLNGLDLLQDISLAYCDLPVILCTASPAFREDPRSLAAHGFVVKSSRVKELKAVIGEVLDKGKSARSTQRPAHGDLHRTGAQENLLWKHAL